MKEIKFRAWDEKFKTMIEPESFNPYDIWISGDGTVFEIEEWSDYSGGGKREIDCTDQYILMQYTGLQDKAGNDIFEGDVLNIGYRVKDGWSFYGDRVIFQSGMFMTINEQTPIWDIHQLCEVIGNIHENPELLKEEQTHG